VHGKNGDVIRLRRAFRKGPHPGTDGLGEVIHRLARELLQKPSKPRLPEKLTVPVFCIGDTVRVYQ